MTRAGPAASPVVAVCGKGGVGKTAVTALVARAMIDAGVAPLLLVDADPMMGLASALARRPRRTLADVRAAVVAAARDGAAHGLADVADYRLLEALDECGDSTLLAMGRGRDKGCFCAVNGLLREALDALRGGHALVLVDAEAGVEQVHRDVTRRVTVVAAVTDGSHRSHETVDALRELLPDRPVAVVANRARGAVIPPGVLGVVPEDPALRDLDAAGRSLWDLPADTPARRAAALLVEPLAALAGLALGPAEKVPHPPRWAL